MNKIALSVALLVAPIMNAVPAHLSPEDTANVAAYFASLPGAGAAAKSEPLPRVAESRVTFPDNYKAKYVRYHTINVPATRQVSYHYANLPAVAAAKTGKDLPDGSVLLAEVYSARLGADGKPEMGNDGYFLPDKLMFYTAMARDAGWGKDIPERLRNEDWNYAVFTRDKMLRSDVNQAECLACHKPLDKVSYAFTLKEMAAVRVPFEQLPKY